MHLNKINCPSLSKKLGLGFLIVLTGSMLTSFVTDFQSKNNIFATAAPSGTPNYLLGNLSNANLTGSRAVEFSHKLANYTKTFLEKSDGNLTKMNMLLLDDLVKRNIIREKDKQELLSFNSGLSQIKPTGNAAMVNKDISSRIENLAKNSSNPVMIVIKDVLKRNTCTPIIGINNKVCLPFSLSNTPQMALNNMTGLPSMTVDLTNAVLDYIHIQSCIALGAASYGGLGALEAGYLCS